MPEKSTSGKFNTTFGEEVKFEISESGFNVTCKFKDTIKNEYDATFRFMEATAVLQYILIKFYKKDGKTNLADACELIIKLEHAIASDDDSEAVRQILKGLNIVREGRDK